MIAAVITAAGKGTRLKSNISKQFMYIYNKPILAHTIQSFEKSKKIDEIYVTVAREYLDYCKKEVIDKYGFKKIRKLIVGGETRQESVYNALKSIPKTCQIVSVHDGVRPLITPKEIDQIINTLINLNKTNSEIKGVIIAAPAYETIKKIDDNNIIDTTINRSSVCIAQTPQTFFYKDLLFAHKKAWEENFIGTDDASLVERTGFKVKVIIGKHENIKITTPLDLFLAELIMERNGKNKK